MIPFSDACLFFLISKEGFGFHQASMQDGLQCHSPVAVCQEKGRGKEASAVFILAFSMLVSARMLSFSPK